MMKKSTTIHTDALGHVSRCEITGLETVYEGDYRTVYELDYGGEVTTIRFQKGAPSLDGFNGTTNEALIAVLLDRLKHMQELTPCLENESAIDGLNVTMRSLRARAERVATQPR
ncbi:hypothetical protein D3C71_78440 [compost metagenome]